MEVDTTKSLEELENDYWEERDTYETSLIEIIYRIRKKPLLQLIPSEIRYFVGQNMGNDYIVPLALDILEKNPYILGTYYEGDLLYAVLNIDIEYWKEHDKSLKQLSEIMVSFNINFTEEIKDLISEQTKIEINDMWKNLSNRIDYLC